MVKGTEAPRKQNTPAVYNVAAGSTLPTMVRFGLERETGLKQEGEEEEEERWRRRREGEKGREAGGEAEAGQ